MAPRLSKRATLVSAAKSSRCLMTVTVLRDTHDTLNRMAALREAVNGGGHLAQNLGEAVDDAVQFALKSGHWSPF